MSYKTVLVHVDNDSQAQHRIDVAASIASAEEAHLIGAAPNGVSRLIYQSSVVYAGGGTSGIDAHIETLRDRARTALARFEDIARRSGVRSYEARQVDDEAGSGICLQARYSDLVVIGQNNPAEESVATLKDFPEFVLMNSGRPVLILPYAGAVATVGKRALIAWDASTSATRAVTAALPLLRRAEHVDLAVFNPDSGGNAHGEQPGADIALYLARHGVKVNVVRQKTRLDIGNALLSMAADLNSDLLVMGGYGHSRFREILLGGVTRTVMTSMTIPVLMAH